MGCRDRRFAQGAWKGTSNIKRWDYQKMKGIKIPYIPVCLSQLPQEFRGAMMKQGQRIRSPSRHLSLAQESPYAISCSSFVAGSHSGTFTSARQGVSFS